MQFQLVYAQPLRQSDCPCVTQHVCPRKAFLRMTRLLSACLQAGFLLYSWAANGENPPTNKLIREADCAEFGCAVDLALASGS